MQHKSATQEKYYSSNAAGSILIMNLEEVIQNS